MLSININGRYKTEAKAASFNQKYRMLYIKKIGLNNPRTTCISSRYMRRLSGVVIYFIYARAIRSGHIFHAHNIRAIYYGYVL